MNCSELISKLTPLHGVVEARAIVRMAMEERFGLSHTDLLLGKDKDLSADDRKDFEKIAFRLLSGEPVQYVLGYADFCGHRFRVTPDVLIPRPETEFLTRLAIDELASRKSANDKSVNCKFLNVLDLCTGSGCIAISIAFAYPTAHVYAVDASEAALTIAKENATSLGVHNIEFIRQDILNSPPPGDYRGLTLNPEPFSLLLSNPPYVRQSEAREMSQTVLNHEPHLALFVPDDDPLRFYRAIATIGLTSLAEEGVVLVEINTYLSEETRQLFLNAGYSSVEILNDQFDRPRVLRAKLKD